jgi:rare lipoprotein A
MRIGTTIGLSLALLVVSAAAMAKEARSAPHHPATSLKAKAVRAATAPTRSAGKRHLASRETAARAHHRASRLARRDVAALPPPDEYLGAVRVIGRREVGSAAWYGGRHIGRRTASGERLDAVHATAAHRSLPLDTLVRVTNLRNGRSVIAKINDRGPVSHSLLIDVSPRAAAALDMLHSGIAQVTIEPVAPVPAQAH